MFDIQVIQYQGQYGKIFQGSTLDKFPYLYHVHCIYKRAFLSIIH